MWLAVTFAAIAFSGTVFMVFFLLALLRERAPSVCYWVFPVHGRVEKGRHLEVLGGIYGDQGCRETEGDYRDCRFELVELLENENHANEGASGVIALDVRPAFDGLGWRSIHSGRGYVCREHKR
ncbi:MAG: hypothetical protein ACYDDS_20260 [Candidatus Sulfotelmatobacter sp.]